MIVITHKQNKVVSVLDYTSKKTINISTSKLVEAFFEVAKANYNRLIVWCHDDLKVAINEEEIIAVFHHKLIMASFEVRNSYCIDKRIGYVESSPFIKVNKNVNYPTWLMSSCIGGIYAEALLQFKHKDFKHQTFDFVLNSIAKSGIKNGLFCYSSPKLLKPNSVVLESIKPSTYELFKFIKWHYRSRWALLTLFNSMIYEKRFLILPYLSSFFTSGSISNPNFKDVEVVSAKRYNPNFDIDVVIPTIGRATFLYDVLQDLASQTLLPKNVIIVEQNPDANSKSELDFLTTKAWPFKIKHSFIHQTGACNARNTALKQVESEWVFLADDDIRFDNLTIEKALNSISVLGVNAATLSCLKEGEKEKNTTIKQWHTFGSGCSIICNEIAKRIAFDIAYEHGFGEDGDFGMQLRNLGDDIAYLPQVHLVHLKAPIGGFRAPFIQPWQNDEVQPKPSPTIMLYNLKHQTDFQIKGYKTLLFFKYFKLQSNKNIVSYFSQMRERWKSSEKWANQLKAKTSI
ncbi:glycosyl transferase [Aquaticitalea lipolytica]|uniref:Glycosyl transferase n=1 Tax=Aquaticitalea lipolytica TaxID=1247562 RepID=A0A8J2XFA1_9FLAO|nr:glycosyltransferase family A protein [Aquaticitalea lipolytica]GFZ78018.1 glycosyl transferase [Aquaticitalea lipolytica]